MERAIVVLGQQRGFLAASALAAAQALRVQAREGLVGPLAVKVIILAVRSVAPWAALVTGKNVLGVVRGVLADKGALWRLLLQAASVWMLAETLFWVYMESCRRHLNSQTNRRWQAVSARSTPEKRTRSLERWLLSLVQVCMHDRSSSPSQARKWEDTGDITSADLQLAKWTNLAGFFYGAGKGEVSEIAAWLRRGNLEEWVSHYWFHGACADELKQRNPSKRAELAGLVNIVVENMGLDLREGRNDRLHARQVYSDPLRALHRPMLVYAGTSLLCPLMTGQVMSMIGFRRERIGGLTYWHRPSCSGIDPAVDIAGTTQTPMVVVHGLGVGLLPYCVFVMRLARNHGGDIFVPELPFLAATPHLSAPSPREVVAQLTEMLDVHGHTAAHFTGHSFGTVVVGWVLKMSPISVACVTLLDPACFLMMSKDLIKAFCGPASSASDMLCMYFVFQELSTHNVVAREYFWEDCQIWPEDLHVPSVIGLAGDDRVVAPSLCIRRLLDHEREQRRQGPLPPKRRQRASRTSGTKQPNNEPIDIHWCEGFMHGEILLRPRSQDELFAKMRRMAHSMDGRVSDTPSVILAV
jgi:hypothetical protein